MDNSIPTTAPDPLPTFSVPTGAARERVTERTKGGERSLTPTVCVFAAKEAEACNEDDEQVHENEREKGIDKDSREDEGTYDHGEMGGSNTKHDMAAIIEKSGQSGESGQSDQCGDTKKGGGIGFQSQGEGAVTEAVVEKVSGSPPPATTSQDGNKDAPDDTRLESNELTTASAHARAPTSRRDSRHTPHPGGSEAKADAEVGADSGLPLAKAKSSPHTHTPTHPHPPLPTTPFRSPFGRLITEEQDNYYCTSPYHHQSPTMSNTHTSTTAPWTTRLDSLILAQKLIKENNELKLRIWRMEEGGEGQSAVGVQAQKWRAEEKEKEKEKERLSDEGKSCELAFLRTKLAAS